MLRIIGRKLVIPDCDRVLGTNGDVNTKISIKIPEELLKKYFPEGTTYENASVAIKLEHEGKTALSPIVFIYDDDGVYIGDVSVNVTGLIEAQVMISLFKEKENPEEIAEILCLWQSDVDYFYATDSVELGDINESSPEYTKFQNLLNEINIKIAKIQDATTEAKNFKNAAQVAKESAESNAEQARSSALKASVSEEAAKSFFESAENAANTAESAKEAIQKMNVSSETLPADYNAFVNKNEENGIVNLHFGIPKGHDGSKGIGIKEIKQIKSSEDDGANTWIVVLTNNTQYSFEVKNGSKGSSGANGKDGYSPKKGVDYFTIDDINEIADYIYGLLPDYVTKKYVNSADNHILEKISLLDSDVRDNINRMESNLYEEQRFVLTDFEITKADDTDVYPSQIAAYNGSSNVIIHCKNEIIGFTLYTWYGVSLTVNGEKVFECIDDGNEHTYALSPTFMTEDVQISIHGKSGAALVEILDRKRFVLRYDNRENLLSAQHLTPEQFGAVGDGVTDDTQAIQTMVSWGKENGITTFVFGSAKTYKVSLPEIENSNDYSKNDSNALDIRKIINVDFDNASFDLNKSTIILSSNMYPYYEFFSVTGNNCSIFNGTLIGDKDTHDYNSFIYRPSGNKNTHEFGYGIRQENCIDLLVENMNIHHMTGDAICIGDSSKKIIATIKSCNLHHCRRQGISILSGDSVYIYDTKIHHIGSTNGTTGTAPMSGIDIEPDGDSPHLNAVYMDNLKIEQCENSALIGGNYTDKISVINSFFEGIVNTAYKVWDYFNCKFLFDENSLHNSIQHVYQGNYTNCIFDLNDMRSTYLLAGVFNSCDFNALIIDDKSPKIQLGSMFNAKKCKFNNIIGNDSTQGIYISDNKISPFIECEFVNTKFLIVKWSKDWILEKTIFKDCYINFANNPVTLNLMNCTFNNCSTYVITDSLIFMDNCYFLNTKNVFNHGAKIIRNSYIEIPTFKPGIFNLPVLVKHQIINTTIKWGSSFDVDTIANNVNCFNVIFDTKYNTEEEINGKANMINTHVISTEPLEN